MYSCSCSRGVVGVGHREGAARQTHELQWHVQHSKYLSCPDGILKAFYESSIIKRVSTEVTICLQALIRVSCEGKGTLKNQAWTDLVQWPLGCVGIRIVPRGRGSQKWVLRGCWLGITTDLLWAPWCHLTHKSIPSYLIRFGARIYQLWLAETWLSLMFKVGTPLQ